MIEVKDTILTAADFASAIRKMKKQKEYSNLMSGTHYEKTVLADMIMAESQSHINANFFALSKNKDSKNTTYSLNSEIGISAKKITVNMKSGIFDYTAKIGDTEFKGRFAEQIFQSAFSDIVLTNEYKEKLTNFAIRHAKRNNLEIVVKSSKKSGTRYIECKTTDGRVVARKFSETEYQILVDGLEIKGLFGKEIWNTVFSKSILNYLNNNKIDLYRKNGQNGYETTDKFISIQEIAIDKFASKILLDNTYVLKIGGIVVAGEDSKSLQNIFNKAKANYNYSNYNDLELNILSALRSIGR